MAQPSKRARFLAAEVDDPICRFFIRGTCSNGAACRFRHEDPANVPCRFFARGACSRGKECLYLHAQVPAKPPQFSQHEDANAAPGLQRGSAKASQGSSVAEPRSARSILHRYSASSIAKAAGQEVRIKGRPPPQPAGPAAPQCPVSEVQGYAEEEEEEEEEEFESDPVVQAVDAGPTEPAGNPHVADLATTDPYL
eukprot:s1287_g3.t1